MEERILVHQVLENRLVEQVRHVRRHPHPPPRGVVSFAEHLPQSPDAKISERQDARRGAAGSAAARQRPPLPAPVPHASREADPLPLPLPFRRRRLTRAEKRRASAYASSSLLFAAPPSPRALPGSLPLSAVARRPAPSHLPPPPSPPGAGLPAPSSSSCTRLSRSQPDFAGPGWGPGSGPRRNDARVCRNAVRELSEGRCFRDETKVTQASPPAPRSHHRRTHSLACGTLLGSVHRSSTPPCTLT